MLSPPLPTPPDSKMQMGDIFGCVDYYFVGGSLLWICFFGYYRNCRHIASVYMFCDPCLFYLRSQLPDWLQSSFRVDSQHFWL